MKMPILLLSFGSHQTNIVEVLAERACLATGIHLKTKVIAADKRWAKMELDIEICLIR